MRPQRTGRPPFAGPKPPRHLGSDVQSSFDMFVNARLDHPSEFFVVEGGAIFFDQTAEFIEQEVVALDVIVEVFDGFSGICLNRRYG